MDEKREAYLRSPEWKARSDAALEYWEHRCALCNSKGELEIHHRTYERLYHEEPGDLTVLCRACHSRHHKALAKRAAKARAQVRSENAKAKRKRSKANGAGARKAKEDAKRERAALYASERERRDEAAADGLAAVQAKR